MLEIKIELKSYGLRNVTECAVTGVDWIDSGGEVGGKHHCVCVQLPIDQAAVCLALQ